MQRKFEVEAKSLLWCAFDFTEKDKKKSEEKLNWRKKKKIVSACKAINLLGQKATELKSGKMATKRHLLDATRNVKKFDVVCKRLLSTGCVAGGPIGIQLRTSCVFSQSGFLKQATLSQAVFQQNHLLVSNS